MLDKLPPELLLEILDISNFRSPPSSSSYRERLERPHVDALRACTLVCKSTSSIARPELWREVSTEKSLTQYLHLYRMRSIPGFQSLAELVRVLEWQPPAVSERELRFEHPPPLPRLQELRVFGELVCIEPDMFPQLKHLIVNEHAAASSTAHAKAVLAHFGFPTRCIPDNRLSMYPCISDFGQRGGWRAGGLKFSFSSGVPMPPKLCYSIRHDFPLMITFQTPPQRVTCYVHHADAAFAAHGLSRTLVSAKLQPPVYKHPVQIPPDVEISFSTSDVREGSSSLLNTELDRLPCLETIFLPAHFRRLDPSTLSTSAQQARDTFLAQCEGYKVQVCYLSDEGKSEWPEWASGMRELDELVEAE